MKRDQRWTCFLLFGINGLGVAIMWAIQLFLGDKIGLGSNGMFMSLWDCLLSASSFSEFCEIVEELSVSDYFYRERLELAVYSLAAVCFAVLIGISLYRLRPLRFRLRWRLATVMLIIALFAIEYSLSVSAWDLKGKWNRCFMNADHWARERQACGSESCQECRDLELQRNEKEQKYRHLVWNPWTLSSLSRDELSNMVNEDDRNTKQVHVPIQRDTETSAGPLQGTGSR